MDPLDPLDPPAPPARFNVAAHLLGANAAHPDRIAYVDDGGTLTYGGLADRARRLASGLRALGIRREERVLLVMNDGRDWPVVFLGAIHAGVVPVAVNPLLPADDLAYMVAHARAQAVFASGSVAPTLRDALSRATAHEVRHVVVSGAPAGGLGPGETAFDALLDAQRADEAPAPTHADEPAFWLYSRSPSLRTDERQLPLPPTPTPP